MHPVGDYPGPVAYGRRWRGPSDPDGKEQSDAVRTPEVEICSDDGFEEESSLLLTDRNPLAGELEADLHAGASLLMGFEGAHFFLSDADYNDALAGGEVSAVRCGDGVLSRPGSKCTTGIAWRVTNCSTAVTNRSCIGLNSAGDGIGLPRQSRKK